MLTRSGMAVCVAKGLGILREAWTGSTPSPTHLNNMTNWKRGMKAVCVDDGGANNIKNGSVYTVSNVLAIANGLTFFEVDPLPGFQAFHAWRFRPLVDDRIDHMLDDIESDTVEERELLPVLAR